MSGTMGVTATLLTKAASVQPGGETSCEIRIRNSGQIVDQFTLEVLGDASGWAVVEPTTVSLFPGAEAVARIRFRPPKISSIPAKSIPFAVRVRSHEDARASMVEEGVVEVGPFHDTFAELVPRTTRGSRHARAQLALDNRGNVRINARLTATDPDRKLNFSITPPGLVAEPGTASFARVRLTPRDRFFTGPPKTLPYKVFVHQEGAPPIGVDGVMLQEGILPGWLIPAAVGLLALAIALTVLWLTLLQPTIRQFAQNAAAPQAAAARAAAAKAEQAAVAAGAAAGARTGAPKASPAAGAGSLSAGGPNPLAGDAVSGHLQTDKSVEDQKASLLLAPTGKTNGYTITDLVFENPAGDFGSLQLVRVTPNKSTEVLFSIRLENFRDLDFHFVTPLFVTNGQHLQLVSDKKTTATMYYSGYFKGS
jgi:hypothetical protein